MAIAENHVTPPQKTDLTIPMVQHRRSGNKVGCWDFRGPPSRREEDEAVIVDFDDQAGGQQVVQRLIGFIVFNV